MKKLQIRYLALLLAVSLLLSGCQMMGLPELFQRLGQAMGGHVAVCYEDMVYQRPDLTYLEQVLEESCALAAKGENLDQVLSGIFDFYDVYDDFYTNMNLAYLRYSADLRDTYWSAEYAYCSERYPQVDAALEKLYMALAASPLRQELEGEDYFGPGFFDSYESGQVWDEGFLSLLEEETALENQYYELMSQGGDPYSAEFLDANSQPLAELLAQLVAQRQQIAAYMGYDSYPQFAYDFYHDRDYTPEQAQEYAQLICQELVPLYRQVNESGVWDLAWEPCGERDLLDYVRGCARAMGGTMEQAFSLMQSAGLYDISYGEYKLDTSFEVYLDGFGEPFIFLCPTGGIMDKLCFAHEFGHFARDYASYGTYTGTDVAEVLSQAMEYLSLCYGENTEVLERLKLADSLSIYVEQVAYADFEHRLYGLTGDELTAEKIADLYEQIGMAYGFDSWEWDRRDFVLVPHFYMEPMYVISYVVSNDAALQLYELEKRQKGAGLELYERMLVSEEVSFGSFAAAMFLDSPFTAERVAQVRRTLEEGLQ